MKNILLIHPTLPYPPKNGADQALYTSILAVQHYFNVFLCYPVLLSLDSYNDQEAIFREKYPNIKLCPYHKTHQSVNQPLFIRLWWSLSRLAEKYLHYTEHVNPKDPNDDYQKWISLFLPQNSTFMEHVNQVIAENEIDLVQVEMPGLLSCVLGLPSQLLKIFVHHELAFVRHGLEVDISRSNNYVQGIYEESKLLEVCLLNKYDGIITLSNIDKNKLIKAGVTSPIYSSFASVDTKPSKRSTLGDGLLLSFIGTSNHLPNYNGIKWFLDNCWSSLLCEDSRYRLQIIGEWSDVLRDEFLKKYPNITFTGFVKDTLDYLQGTILIVPILVGSGIRMKILEGATLGIPIVTTSVGCEGIDVVDGVHCSIADEPKSFIGKITQLKSQEIQQRYIDNFGEFVTENYSIEALSKNRKAIYQEIVGNEFLY